MVLLDQWANDLVHSACQQFPGRVLPLIYNMNRMVFKPVWSGKGYAFCLSGLKKGTVFVDYKNFLNLL